MYMTRYVTRVVPTIGASWSESRSPGRANVWSGSVLDRPEKHCESSAEVVDVDDQCTSDLRRS